MHKSKKGYSIVELVIVIVIIGILAGIGYVVYNGVQRDTKNKAKASQITAISEALEKYHEENGEYPSCDDMSSDTAGEILGVDQSLFVMPGDDKQNSFTKNCKFPEDDDYNSFYYDGVGPCSVDEYSLDEPCYEFDLGYYDDEDEVAYSEKFENKGIIGGKPNIEKIPSKEIILPEEIDKYLNCEKRTGKDNYVPIPGSKTYGTKSFCVMKYEVRKGDNSEPLSVASGYEIWKDISQKEAIFASKDACIGCRLVTEAQWMTIAEHITNNTDDNWYTSNSDDFDLISGFSGNNGNELSSAETGDLKEFTTPERRYFKLPGNNEIIDFAGNLPEWTQGKISPFKQPGFIDNIGSTDIKELHQNIWQGTQGFEARDLGSISNINQKAVKNNWVSGHGPDNAGIGRIGYLWSNYNYSGTDKTDLGFVRGGGYNDEQAGLFSLYLIQNDKKTVIINHTDPNELYPGLMSIGFRVAK